MKRSPLRRKTPLRPGKGLRAGRRKSYGTGDERLDFKLAVEGKPCVVCGKYEWDKRDYSWRKIDAHHGISQSWLKRHGFADRLWDVRNAVPLCEEPCHRRMTSRKRPVLWDELPAPVFAFARDLGPAAVLYIARTYPMRLTP